ncbi:HAD family hydrolase [Aeromicrobium choanae]|uniref:Phosphoserine phosphatase n=1 Tax=Aeromicrobium choanae TaxID=1736691 RepID=A0A1T4Z990_9ACTN|nr:HAD family hydrolase [Aeromicrobium choanae]SKB10171.1 Phosphoserine phosphatase [Aeromicrobium choanae]
MTEERAALPSWRPGQARDEILAFLEASGQIPPEDRLACFDNDGTLWCERPRYIQLEFLLHHLQQRVQTDPALGTTPEFSAVLSGDAAALEQVGLPRIAMALTGLFAGLPADRFKVLVREFMAAAANPALGRPHRSTVYRPMLELVDELRLRGFAIAVVTGGGTEFVRAVSQELYGVDPERVVGTLIEYDFADGEGGPVLTRTNRVSGTLNDGPDKVSHIQAQLGRRPVFAAGNTSGDREMLTWAETADGPSLALLVDHDDEEREFSYPGTGESATPTEPITDVAHRRGWTVASIARDWAEVFP